MLLSFQFYKIESNSHFLPPHRSLERVDVPSSFSDFHKKTVAPGKPDSLREAAVVKSLAKKKTTEVLARQWTTAERNVVMRWGDCKTIPYYVNLNGNSARALKAIRTALRQVSAIAGYSYSYRGSTTAIPYGELKDNSGVPRGGLYFAWATAKQVSGLSGNVIGLGGTGDGYRIGAVEGLNKNSYYVSSGAVVLDKKVRFTSLMGRGESLKALLLHEIGHAMGLGHVRSKRDAMYPMLGKWSPNNLGPGDRLGLRSLGRETAQAHSCSL